MSCLSWNWNFTWWKKCTRHYAWACVQKRWHFLAKTTKPQWNGGSWLWDPQPRCRTIFLLVGLSLESHRTLFWKSFHPQFLHERWCCSWSPLPICCTMLPFATFIDSRCLEHFLKSHGPCWEIPSIPNFWHEHCRCSRLPSHEKKFVDLNFCGPKFFYGPKFFLWLFVLNSTLKTKITNPNLPYQTIQCDKIHDVQFICQISKY